MAFAYAVELLLHRLGITYELHTLYRHTTPHAAASQLGFTLDALARALLLHDRAGPVLAILPANRQLELSTLRRHLARPQLLPLPAGLLRHHRIHYPAHSLPPLAQLHQLTTVVDLHLVQPPQIWLSTGIEGQLICLASEPFCRLQGNASWCQFTQIQAHRPRYGRTPYPWPKPEHGHSAIRFPRRARRAQRA